MGEPVSAIAPPDFHLQTRSHRAELKGRQEPEKVLAPGSRALSASLMLICAVLVSLALGVLVAYGLCQLMFRVFYVHSISAARQRAERKAAASVQIAA
jgi:hypothetical protein